MRRIIVLFIMVLFSVSSLLADTVMSAEERLKSYQKHMEMKEHSLFKQLEWKNIGP
ncbi:MAG: hypothetical protein GY950_24185, partial [bacterium]|nr:hypothetical protein [bacterium]